MKISHEVVNQSAGERVRGDLHIQTVNSLHERIKTFLRARRGVATKYLDNYLRWFHLAGLQHAPTPRACLNAAIGPQLKMAIPTYRELSLLLSRLLRRTGHRYRVRLAVETGYGL